MRRFIFRLQYLVLASSLFLLGSPAPWAAQSDWPPPPSRLDLPTPYGELHIKPSEYIYESRLRVNNVDVSPEIEGILNITYAFATPHAHAALISINSGNDQCPMTYRWIILNEKGYKVSPVFGSCSPRIKVFATRRTFVVETPSDRKPDKIDIYVYDGKTIKHRTKP